MNKDSLPISRLRIVTFGLVVFLLGIVVSRILFPGAAAPHRVEQKSELEDVRQFVRKGIGCKATLDPLPGECTTGGFIEARKSDGSPLIHKYGELTNPTAYQDRYLLRSSCLPPTTAADACCSVPPCEQRLCVEVAAKTQGGAGKYEDLFAGSSPVCPGAYLGGGGTVWISCPQGQAVQAINFNTQEVLCASIR